MRGGVIALGIAAAIARNRRPCFSKLHRARAFSERSDAPVDFAHFVDVDAPPFALDLTTVGDLSAGFGVEWRRAGSLRRPSGRSCLARTVVVTSSHSL
jgi:hypothetical protein